MKLKSIIIVILVSVSASSVLFVVLHLHPTKDSEEDPNCDAENCNQTIEESTTKPCDSFYDSVCGDLSKTLTLQMSQEVYKSQNSKVLNILNDSDNLNMTKAASIVRGFYSICQEPDSDVDNLNKILDLFRKSGGFPVLEGANIDDRKWCWLESTQKLRRLGLFTDSLFTAKLGSNPSDLRNVTLYIDYPRLDLAQKDYCAEGLECMVPFVIEFVKVVMQFGATREVALEDGIGIFGLEKKLLNIVWDNPSTSKESLAEYQGRTLANLSSSFGFINWTEYFTTLLGSQEFVAEDVVVVVESPGYLRSLGQVLKETPNRLLANFMMWSALSRLQEYIPGHRRNSLDCYKFLQNSMSYALQSMYAHTFKSSDSKSEKVVLEIANKIKEELVKRLSSLDLMSGQTRQEAVEKVEKIEIKVGYPQILLNSTFIDEYYGNLSLCDNALESMLAIQKFHVNKYFDLCCKRVEEIFWDISIDVFLPTVYYDSAQNSIHILQGALQYPIFNEEMSMSEHFGRLGSIIAHEMTHAVDSIGFRYNADGKRKTSPDDSYLAAFEKKSQCFADHYNSFMEFTEGTLLQNPQISGDFKRLEIIADSIGVDLSFTAYKRYEQASNQSESKLTDRRFTPEQQFFLSFAQFYCVKYSLAEVFQVLLDDHAPNPYRVNGALSNSQDFAKVFDCESGSRMNSMQKCKML